MISSFFRKCKFQPKNFCALNELNRLLVKSIFLCFLFLFAKISTFAQSPQSNDTMLVYCVDPSKQLLKFYWKDNERQPFRNFANLSSWLYKKGEKLVFAVNGGMYKTGNAPLGLYIDSGKTIAPLNKTSAPGNFYLKPNGVFYITRKKTAAVCVTEKFRAGPQILYATQSGPMLVADGKIHPEFREGSVNLNIRNAVGILPSGRVMFVMSKIPVNFYEFARFFLKWGCKNALYLDGFVSRTYLPAQNYLQTGGNFGVIIAETVAIK